SLNLTFSNEDHILFVHRDCHLFILSLPSSATFSLYYYVEFIYQAIRIFNFLSIHFTNISLFFSSRRRHTISKRDWSFRRVLFRSIEGMKAISRVDMCLMDVEGKVLVSTFAEPVATGSEVMDFVGSQADSQIIKGFQYFKVYDEHQLEYVLVVNGSDDLFMIGKMAAFQIENLLIAYKERFDKDNFIKNLLLDNLLLVDIYNRAKKLHIDVDARRVVFILETDQSKDYNLLECIKNMFHGKSGDFITAVDEK